MTPGKPPNLQAEAAEKSGESQSARAKLGVLLSGRGSNFEAIAKAVAQGQMAADVAVVISNRPEARGLELARRMGIPAYACPSAKRERQECEAEILSVLQGAQVDLVCLAGYMRLVGPTLLRAYPLRILNIHPSLLPAFPGLDAQRQALEYGVKVAGCTVHFVNDSLDGGPIVAQAAVPVVPGDDEHSLSARILEHEHRLYPEAIRKVLAEGWTVEGRRVVFKLAT